MKIIALLIFFNAFFICDAKKLSPESKKLNIDRLIHEAEASMNFEISFWQDLAKKSKSENYPEGEAKCLNNVGYILNNQGKQEESVKYYHQALDIYNKINSAEGKAGVYNDLAGIYSNINEKKKAKEFYNKAYTIYTKLENKSGVSMTAHNLSSIFADEKDYEKAKWYARLSYTISLQIKDSAGLPSILNNIGALNEREGKIDSAIYYYSLAFNITKKINLKEGIGFIGISLGENFFTQYKNKLKNGVDEKRLLDSCEKYLLLSYNTGIEILNPEIIKRASQRLMRYHEYKNNWEKAFYYSDNFHNLKDTLDNAERQKEILKSQLTYEHNLEKLKTEEKNKADRAIAEEQAKQQKIIIGGAIVLIVFLFVFVLLIRKKWKETQHQKIIIEEQKAVVDEKQKEIIDSINYAQRLQHAILAPELEIKKYFPESFLFYLPKDIVAGDFYFFEKTETHIFYAAADCTGHGVPGAMVSIVCSNALTRSVKEFGLTDPGKILDKTRELILETFEKSGDDVKDGMDISLIAVTNQQNNKSSTRQITWAGANNPLWYIQKSPTGQLELVEVVPDKQSIGKTEKPKPFTTHLLPLSLSALYLFTDGFADQFGGERGKKFKYSNLQKLLLESSTDNSEVQKVKLESSFNNWKNDLEQVDDVCIIGVRL